MAEEEEKKNGQEEEQMGSGLDAPKEKKTDKKKILIIAAVVIVVLIIIISIVLTIVMTSDDSQDTLAITEETAEFVAQYEKRKQLTIFPNQEPIYTDPFAYTVNLQDGRHMIRISLRAKLYDPMAKMYLDARTPIIDDNIITLLKSVKTEELQTRSGVDLLKRKLFKSFNETFSQEFIEQSISKDRTPVKEI
ncbi:flagellar basal body-associated FliL family protein, partial [bacterium]|nr:flagellar basal body-associated FliL family protein [bacterium]